MEDEAGVDLGELSGFGAEVQEGRESVERSCLGTGKVREFEKERIGEEEIS